MLVSFNQPEQSRLLCGAHRRSGRDDELGRLQFDQGVDLDAGFPFREIQNVGFMPDASTYGMNHRPTNGGGNDHPSNGTGSGDGHPSNRHRAPALAGKEWNCTDGQKGFILRIINESKLEKPEVEAMAQHLFGVGVKELDKRQASQLIEEPLKKSGQENRRPPLPMARPSTRAT